MNARDWFNAELARAQTEQAAQVAPPAVEVAPAPEAVAPVPEAVAPVLVAASPEVVAASPAPVATTTEAVAVTTEAVAVTTEAVVIAPTAVATSPTVVATSPTVVATSPTVVATSPTVVATSPTVVAAPKTVVATAPAVGESATEAEETAPVLAELAVAEAEPAFGVTTRVAEPAPRVEAFAPAALPSVRPAEPMLVDPVAAAPHEPRKSLLATADLHCHLLPAWDDGARDLDTSLEMVRRAALFGCEAILVTPHVGKALSAPVPAASRIARAVATLQRELTGRGVRLQLVPGAEVALSSPRMLDRILREPELSVGGMGRYVLIEPPGNSWPDWMETAVLRLTQQGITPILAHPERFGAVQRDPRVLTLALSVGALVQVTADAIAGEMGRSARKCALELLEMGWASLVASDAHNASATLPSEVADEVRAHVGADAARIILEENPFLVLRGEPVSLIA